MKKRWQKFNFAEWRADENLKRCSRAARSFWLDLCGLIYAADAGGRLLINDGQIPTDRDLSAMLGDDIRTVRRLLLELEANGVFDRLANGCILSRRILREEVSADLSKKFGELGGNPALKINGEAENGVNPHIPETRDQKESSEIPKGISVAPTPREEPAPLASGGDVWNIAAELINHDNPDAGRKVVGLINREEVAGALGQTPKAASVMRKAVLALLEGGHRGEAAIEYLRKTARRMAAETGGAKEPDRTEATRLFRIVERNGVRYRVDNATGAEVEIGKAAA